MGYVVIQCYRILQKKNEETTAIHFMDKLYKNKCLGQEARYKGIYMLHDSICMSLNVCYTSIKHT